MLTGWTLKRKRLRMWRQNHNWMSVEALALICIATASTLGYDLEHFQGYE